MKLPAVAIVVGFAGGILLGLEPLRAFHAAHSSLPAFIGAAIISLLIAGFVLAWRGFVWASATISLAVWVGLGVFGGWLAELPLPAEHILSRFAAAQIPLKTPLRWHGVLLSEPTRLPWGYGLDVSLTGVEKADGYLAVIGGMRVGFTPRENETALPELHAGDEISVLTEARLPTIYKDAGAFDRREFLARQGIFVLATLRASTLLERTGSAPDTLRFRIARLRGRLRDSVDRMFPGSPQSAGILRAMLLGDRSFVDRVESADFQKTGVFHVLVVAGLHVGALAVFLFWLAKKLRLPQIARTCLVLLALLGYVAVVEQRAPVLRAALMAAIVICGAHFYRRLDLLNSAALAALALLVANPTFVTDTGFLLSFLAIAKIAGLALPLIQRRVQPILCALENWRDVTRDASHPVAIAQFRLDFRDAIFAATSQMGSRAAKWVQDFGAKSARVGFRVGELFVLSFVLQVCMLPLMARDFHRVSLLGPVANLFAVPLTGVIVPLGFFSLGLASVLPRAAVVIAHPLIWLVLLQQHIVSLLAAIPFGSYRIPGPPGWVIACFFLVASGAVVCLRAESRTPRWPLRVVSVLLILMAVVIATHPFRPLVTRGDLEVTVLDVGQGDSILVVSPKGSTLLIDGGGMFQGFRGREEHLGPEPGEEAVSAYLWSRGFQRLDAVALTHAHQDHIGRADGGAAEFSCVTIVAGTRNGRACIREAEAVGGKSAYSSGA
ncbi:MAG: ComEC/Rec2 family competence protein [Candidatus Acidiferrum sp.]